MQQLDTDSAAVEMVEIEFEDEAELQAQREQQLQALGGRLLALAEEQVRNRQQIEQRWLEDLRQVHAKLTVAEQQALQDAGKSQIVVNITRNKCNAAEARLADLAAPTDSRHWGISPTPVPELQDALMSQQHVVMPDGQAVPERDIAQQQLEEARRRAERMEQTIDDQLTEAQLNSKIRQIIHDAVRLGTGVIKGPVVVGRSRRAWQEIEQQSGVYQLTFCDEFRPGVEVVSPWNFFPDMRACTIEEAEYVFERKFLTRQMLRELVKRPGYLVDEIKELLKSDPRSMTISSTHADEMREISGVDTVADDNRYELWEYHGEINRDDLMSAGCEIDDDDPLTAYNGIVEFCGTRVIRVLISPMESGDCVYSVLNWENDTSSIFGYGVPYLMRHSQKIINAAWRMLMDNAGLCVGGQIVVDRGKITPADGKWNLSSRKVWWYSDRNHGTVRDAFAVHEIASHQQELANIFAMARQLADEETNLPLIAQGEQTADITDTAKGMSILMASADVVLRKTVKLLDDNVYKPLITRFYDWNMQFNNDDSIKGDFEVDACGSDALLEEAAQERGLMELAQLVNDPTYGRFMKPREMLTRIIKGKKLSPDEVLKSDAEMQQEAQQTQPQPPPEVQLKQMELQQRSQSEQMKAQGEQAKLQIEQAKLQQEAQLKQAEMQQRWQIEQAKISNDRDIAMARLALEREITMEKLYKSLGLEQEKLRTQRQVEGVKAMNFQDELEVKRQTGRGI